IGAIVMVAIGTTQIAYIQHTCGMFKIASYRIEHTAEINIDINKLRNISLRKNNFILNGINYAVDIHRQAMKLSKFLVDIFERSFFWLIIFGVASLSLNLLRIFQINSFIDNIKEFLLHSVFTATCILYMFLANYCGQDVTDHNDNVFATAYKVQWYKASLHTQKLILFLLQRGNKNFTLGVGSLFVGSLDCFASLIKASVSYFTVIYSTR
ncbi:Or9e69NTE, partial [Eciton burchellii]